MKVMDASALRDALISGSNNLAINKNRIDAMNVFPIPDGDTGSNMASTAQNAVALIKDKNHATVEVVANQFARGMLLGARGNSGVILSQIFKGFSFALKDKRDIRPFDLVLAFEKAKEFAYKAVIKPVEGTILTIISQVSEKLLKTVTASNDCAEVFKIIHEVATKACLNTPNLLPILKEVGVTDSGGEGLLMFFEGMLNYLQAKPVKLKDSRAPDLGQAIFSLHRDKKNDFGYCTELIIELKNPKTFLKDKFQYALQKMGESIVLVKDEEILKVHIHTKKSGAVLTFAQRCGEFVKVKIENMTLQANESNPAKNKLDTKITNATARPGKIAIISCNSGAGIIREMEALGASFIIEAGQSANPSARDFIDAINQVRAKKIFILPNNSNIILTARQVVQTTHKEVVVIPTKTQMEGIVVMLNFNPDGNFKAIRESMEDALNDVKTGEVSIASRTTKIEGVQIKKDEYLAIAERKIIKSYETKVEAAVAICKNLINENTEIVTIYYGEDSSEIDAEEIRAFIEGDYETDVEVKFGGQPVYNFLIAFE